MFFLPLTVVITEKVYFSAHSPSVSGAWKARCKAWCLLCVGWRCHDNLLQDLCQRVTKLWRRSWKHSYCKLLHMLCVLLTTGVHFYAHLTVWWSNYLYTTLFCWKFTTSCKMGHYWNYEECCSKYKCLQALKIFFACRFALTVLYWKLLYDFTSFALALKLQFVWCGTCVMRVPEKKQRKQKKQTNKLRAFLTYVVSTSVLQNFDRFFIKYFIFPQHENGNLLTCQLISSMAGLDSFWRTSSTSFQRAWCYLLFQCEQAI